MNDFIIMQKIDLGLLSKVEEKVSCLSDLSEFLSTASIKHQKIRELQASVEQLKSNQHFTMILSKMQELEDVEIKLLKLKEIQKLNETVQLIDKTIATDQLKAYDHFKSLQSMNFSIDWAKEIAMNRLASSRSLLVQFFLSHLSSIVKRVNWPFQSKGDIISLDSKVIAEFKDTFVALADLDSIHLPSSTLITSMCEQISFHFCSSSNTNRIDKPEWMLNYTLQSIKLNISYFLETFELGNQALEKITQLAIEKIIGLISQRIYYDTKAAIKSNKQNLFLHILDECLKFDSALIELKSKVSLLEGFMSEKFIIVWQTYEKTYISGEIEKILDESSWEINKIQGMKYSSLDEITILHNSLMIKYSVIAREDIKKRLTSSMNDAIISIFIAEYTNRFDYLKTLLIHYESNPEMWGEIIYQNSAMHQSLALFQQFLLVIDKESFAEDHAKINQLKRAIADKLLHIIMISFGEIVKEYTDKSKWKELGSLRIKACKSIVKDFRKSCVPEIAKRVLEYSAQKVVALVISGVSGKKLSDAFKSNITQDFQHFFALVNSDEQLNILKDRLQILM